MKFVWLNVLCIVFVFAAGSASAQDGSGDFHLSRRNGYEVTVSIQVTNGKVQKISYSEWTPINRSAHECGLEGRRGDEATKWTEHGNITTISSEDDDPGTLTITHRADGWLVQCRCNDLKILFTWRDTKYAGRILR